MSIHSVLGGGAAKLAERPGVAPVPIPDQDLESETGVFKLSGVIKSFDISKEYGFIIPDGGLPDVLLRVTELREGGFKTACPGAKVVFEATRGPKGLRCTRVVAVDESTAAPRPAAPQKRVMVIAIEPAGLFERAQCKWFNRWRGFGFLTRGEGTPDVFVHATTLQHCNFTELKPGQAVLVRYGQSEKGPVAIEVRPGE